MKTASRRILLVDDDALILELLEARLTSRGYVLATAQDGEQAYALAQRFKPELIICDVVMPRVDGPTFCKRLRAENDSTPFLFLTARGQAKDKIELLMVGADDYLVKPFDPGELLARIAAILR